MNLFQSNEDKNINRLPKDGEVNYYGQLFGRDRSKFYFQKLLASIKWTQDEVVMFGKKITTKRKVAWYGEKPFEYTYSKMTKHALFWTPELLEIKGIIEQETKETFNSCLLNLYHDGEEGMGWHCDDEPELKKEGAIASLSFGVERNFVFKHKASKEKVTMILENGSLLLMKGKTQRFWLHALPKSKKVKGMRMNLTFREIAS